MTIERVNDLFVIAGTIKATGQKIYWEAFDDRETAVAVEQLVTSGDLRFRVGFPVDRTTGERMTNLAETWISERTRLAKLAEIRAQLLESR